MPMEICYWLYVMVAVFGRGRQVAASWWPFSSAGEDGGPIVAREPVAFEMASAEQKFLAEAQQYLDLSPLEACQHKVRM